jgi:sarcosine oxidase subunit gamma
VREVPQIALRGDPSDERFLSACEAVLGARPPTAANTVASDIFWLGPHEWLVVGRAAGTPSRLREALRGIHAAAVDVSAQRVVLELEGPHAPDVLSKAATLDFHLRGFPIGSCAQTNIARAQGLIHRLGANHFRIYVRRSFARYLQAWLDDAKTDYASYL